ncbi:MAG: PTS sugar transporter subunit IIA [Parachlamydiaceae bacterium]|nr:PTS sugar transporter subunit IIA [Parachlamydiaceae bacterium]
MDLKIKEVAELFNVSETTIRRWISDGKIPSYRIDQLHPDYRFSIPEMENWLISHKLAKTNEVSPFAEKPRTNNKTEEDDQKNKGGIKQFSLFRAVHKGDVLHSVPGDSKEDVIRTTMRRSVKNLNIDAEVISELLLDREKLMPTALNNGIGVPHTRDTRHNAHHDVVLVAFPEKTLEYGALDNKPVHTLFFLFACDDKRHLHLLAKIAHLSSQPKAIEFFQTRPSKDQVLDYLKQWESNI